MRVMLTRPVHFFLIMTMTCTLVNGKIQAQEGVSCCSEMACANQEECGDAYAENGRTAHWSAYIPITLMIAAAIFFGFADKKHDKCSSSGDGSKVPSRISNGSSRSCSKERSSGHRSSRSFCGNQRTHHQRAHSR